MRRWRSALPVGLPFLLAVLCWTEAFAAHNGWIGIALVGAPRWSSLPLALLGFGLASVAIGMRPRALLRGAIAGMMGGVALILLVSACTRLHPDRRFLPHDSGAHPDAPFTVTGLAGDGDALLIAPRTRSFGVVVLVHGTGNDRLYGFWYLIDALVARGYSVLTANLPGHGRGGTDIFGLDACRTRLDGLASRARQLGSPVFVLGQSLGGALVLDAVARHADFAGFIAVSAPLDVRVGPRLLRELDALTRPAVYRTLRYGTLADVLPAVGAYRRDEFPVRVRGNQSYVDAVAEAVRGMALASRLEALAGPSAPVLLIHGERDGVVPIAQARSTASALGGRANVLFGEAGHHLDPLFDEAIVRFVIDWIDARQVRGLPR